MSRRGCILHGPSCRTPCPVVAETIALVRDGALRPPPRYNKHDPHNPTGKGGTRPAGLFKRRYRGLS